ncbi:hypothetical protein TBK1r_79270 [Stieleria magnilauensis]|uniref:Uncharacterized protein n=1 Tax=Stieleria magnilauensis TaxID=2527963 RepID=A0ABX5Y519_9BACT|nr:hypothetical protein TBK1r_79270 [Planctomycetes bacterium TBK1r]
MKWRERPACEIRSAPADPRPRNGTAHANLAKTRRKCQHEVTTTSSANRPKWRKLPACEIRAASADPQHVTRISTSIVRPPNFRPLCGPNPRVHAAKIQLISNHTPSLGSVPTHTNRGPHEPGSVPESISGVCPRIDLWGLSPNRSLGSVPESISGVCPRIDLWGLSPNRSFDSNLTEPAPGSVPAHGSGVCPRMDLGSVPGWSGGG